MISLYLGQIHFSDLMLDRLANSLESMAQSSLIITTDKKEFSRLLNLCLYHTIFFFHLGLSGLV